MNYVRALLRRTKNPRRRTAADIEHLLTICRTCEVFDGANCTHQRCGCRVVSKAIWECETCPLDKWPPDVTICITTYLRPDSLARLQASLAKHYTAWRVLIEDTKGNLSRARNRLVSRASSEFVLIAEDDFEFTDSTALSAMLDVLQSDRDVGVICGRLVQGGELLDYATDLRLFRKRLECVQPPSSPWRATPTGTRYRYCDQGWNFFLARRHVLLDNPWDERLELHEHAAWFWTLKQRAQWRVAFTPTAAAVHHHDRPNVEYNKQRKRAVSFVPVLKRRYGFSITPLIGCQAEEPQSGRPNIVLLSTGWAGSTLATRMLFCLGWRPGDADDQFAESMSIRGINERLLAREPVDQSGMIAALQSLPRPWVVKDPRFCETMPKWLDAMSTFQPLLLWVHKHAGEVEASWQRRGDLPRDFQKRFAHAERVFAEWPWTKLALDFDGLLHAAALVDWQRIPLFRHVASRAKSEADLLEHGQELWRQLQSAELVRPAERILDVGAGVGRIALPAARAGHDVVCVEAHPRMREQLEAERLGVVAELAEAPGEFDVALCLWVLEHNTLARARQILLSVHSKLRPGGRLLFTYPLASQLKPEVRDRYVPATSPDDFQPAPDVCCWLSRRLDDLTTLFGGLPFTEPRPIGTHGILVCTRATG